MPKKSKKGIEKKVDKIENKLEKIELKNIQKDYKTKVPALIWLLKILIALVIITIIVSILKDIHNFFNILINTTNLIVNSILLFGLFHRKRWSFYLGLTWFTLLIIFNFINQGYWPFHTTYQIIILILFYWHKDYLNK